MEPNLTARLIDILLRTAKNRGVLSYSRFHALFAGTMTLAARHTLLDEALRNLCDEHEVDYGVLFARDNGLPGSDDAIKRSVSWHAIYRGREWVA
ncbi:hypothetical protein LMG28614_05246 [Paraburkholderia ultramafica]|uniref:Uncharacterized protein n=1 Tax=Paraburkholderia ultramafica TaxID=1544867 RepID=A0A6S7BHP9_9BURK|nr:hypothetical protein [Paraburkholderia ultramafica]CAB3800789.1 hypothetical protein LMG28614_05246 [Paraburkholderia ultramafica]